MENKTTYPGAGLTYYTLCEGDELAVRVGWDDDLGCHEWRRVVVFKVTPTQAGVVMRHPVLGRVMEMRYLRDVTVGSRIPLWPDRMNWADGATYLMNEKFDRLVDEYEFKRLRAKLKMDEYFPLQRKRFFISAAPDSDSRMRDLFFRADQLRKFDKAMPGYRQRFHEEE